MRGVDFRVTCWLMALLFSTGGIVLAGAALAEEKAECERETISMLLSPDDAWVALVQEDVCSGGGFATTGVTDTVQLIRRSEEPKHENDIFALEEHGNPLNRPVTRWLSPQKLQITVPNKSLIGLKKESYEGIDVVIKYEPDNPEEREQFLKGLGLAPK